MRILYDSKNIYHKTPFGCVKENERCSLRLDIPKNCRTKQVHLIIKTEESFEMKVPFLKEKTNEEYECFRTEFSLFQKGLYFYHFFVQTEEGEFYLYKQGADTNIGEGDLWQLTCYDKKYDTPKEYKGKIMYQIFPDRFFRTTPVHTEGKLLPFVLHDDTKETPVYLPDENGKILNNDFYGGTLRGICEKLPYLHELGVEILYLNPIFFAFSNHRYDTADYKRIDPLLGTEKEFIKLCEEAHRLDMKVILDGVFSHTGSNSIYFDKNKIFGNGAYSHEASPYRPWYTFQHYPDRYTSWWGIDTLPCTNELEASFMEYILYSDDSVIKHWLRRGADGFRLDVADELPDTFIKALKKTISEIKPEGILIGEVWEDASNKMSYEERRTYLLGDELDSVMNYPFRNAIIDFLLKRISGITFAEKIMTIAENYPKPILDCLMNSLSTHDTRRILTELSGVGEGMSKEEKAKFRLCGEELYRAQALEKAAVLLQFTLPGNPCIYYGDEIGMEGFEDPLNRTFFTWDTINTDMLDFYKDMIRLKKENPALRFGEIVFEEVGEGYIKFVRKYEEKRMFVTVSFDEKTENKGISLFELKTKFINAALDMDVG